VPGTVPGLPPEAQNYIRALEARLEQAERSLRLLPQQRGPLPGWLRAGTIEASSIITSTITAALLQGPQPPSGPFAKLDLTGNTPGSSPLLDINDGTRDRVQIGNLASYTDPSGIVSPAGYGGRVIDTVGNLLWDAVGHSQVIKLLGSIVNQSQTGVTGNGSWQTVSGTTVNFTPSRPVPVLALGAMTLADPTVGDTGFNLTGTALVDGAQNNANGPVFAPGTSSFSTMYFAYGTFSNAAHSVALGVNQTNTHLWTAINCYLFAFQFGG